MECNIYSSGELFPHHYRENHPLGDALTIMITSDDVSEIMLDANKAGFKLVFNKRYRLNTGLFNQCFE